MFIDFAVLVETQGETINNIESNISNTHDYVIEAKKESKKAVDFQRAARRVRA